MNDNIVPPLSEAIISSILWALCSLVVAMGGALVYVIKTRPKSSAALAGEESTERWDVKFLGWFAGLGKKVDDNKAELAGKLDSLQLSLSSIAQKLHDFLLLRNRDMGEIKGALERVSEDVQDVLKILEKRR